VVLICFLSPQADTSSTLRDHGYGASASHGVPVYVLAFAGTHCTNPRRDGQAELTWVAGYMYRDGLTTCQQSPIQVLTRLGVDLTLLIRQMKLPTKPN